MRSEPLTSFETHNPDAVKAVLTEAFEFFGGEHRFFELTGHANPRGVKHTWIKNGLPEQIAYCLEDSSDGYFNAAELNKAISNRRRIRKFHKQIDKTKAAS